MIWFGDIADWVMNFNAIAIAIFTLGFGLCLIAVAMAGIGMICSVLLSWLRNLKRSVS